MRGSHELVPALECNPCLRMPVPKLDERVSGNDPHGGLYHVPKLGTTLTPSDCTCRGQDPSLLSGGQSSPRGLVLLLVSLSQPDTGATAVLVDKVRSATRHTLDVASLAGYPSPSHDQVISRSCLPTPVDGRVCQALQRNRKASAAKTRHASYRAAAQRPARTTSKPAGGVDRRPSGAALDPDQ